MWGQLCSMGDRDLVNRYAGKPDENQAEIVAALRGVGASVAITSQAGKGFPDLVVGFRGVNYLIEVIGPGKIRNYRKTGGLMPNQVEWHDAWRGQCAVAHNVEEALAIIGMGSIEQHYRGIRNKIIGETDGT